MAAIPASDFGGDRTRSTPRHTVSSRRGRGHRVEEGQAPSLPSTPGEIPMHRDRNLARTTICVLEGQLTRLRELSESTGAPVSWLIRASIAEYLAGIAIVPVARRDSEGAAEPRP